MGSLPPGIESSGLHTPGIMLSGRAAVAARQQNMPAGERYLTNQRLASSQLPLSAAPGGSTGNGFTSPRQTRMASPITNYQVVHSVERVDRIDHGQAMDPPEMLRRRQGSPLREPLF